MDFGHQLMAKGDEIPMALSYSEHDLDDKEEPLFQPPKNECAPVEKPSLEEAKSFDILDRSHKPSVA